MCFPDTTVRLNMEYEQKKYKLTQMENFRWAVIVSET